MSAEASELVSIPRAELDALKAELKRLRREVGRGAAMARIQAPSRTLLLMGNARMLSDNYSA